MQFDNKKNNEIVDATEYFSVLGKIDSFFESHE